MSDRTWDTSEERTELKILNELLHQPGTTVEYAVDSMVSWTEANMAGAGECSVGARAEALACEVLDLAASLEPGQQTKLVEFLVQLQSRDMKDPATDAPLQTDPPNDTRLVWTDMPYLQSSLFYRYQDFAFGNDANSDTRDLKAKTRAQCVEWANLHAFMAQLTHAAPEVDLSKQTSKDAFVSLYFGHRLADTLETALEGDFADSKSLAESAAARAACTCLIYGGQALWDRATGAKTDYVPDVIPLPNESKITRARWSAWHAGLKRLHEACPSGEMGDLVYRAIMEMERVQGSS